MFLFNKQQECSCTYSDCIKYLKLRSVGKTLKIVKCTVRSEPKYSKQEQAQLTMLLKEGSRRPKT